MRATKLIKAEKIDITLSLLLFFVCSLPAPINNIEKINDIIIIATRKKHANILNIISDGVQLTSHETYTIEATKKNRVIKNITFPVMVKKADVNKENNLIVHPSSVSKSFPLNILYIIFNKLGSFFLFFFFIKSSV